MRQGIVVPFRKDDAEKVRRFAQLQAADRGGLMFQPRPGIYENVDEIDFTSMYPAIIVDANLSPEMIGCSSDSKKGFLPAALKPLLNLRVTTKRMKKTNPEIEGIDAILKWMLVTCFGYTGYRNAKFGRIEVHEGITGKSREILVHAKDIAESMEFRVLHGIVDCLWIQGSASADLLKSRIEKETGLLAEVEHFDWIVFEPLNDGSGAYNRYFGRLEDGTIKMRGIAARRHDTPLFISTMQKDMLAVMARAKTIAELDELRDEITEIYQDAIRRLSSADPQEMVISRRISRLSYNHRCIEGSAVNEHLRDGAAISPGMKIQYVVRDAGRYIVDPVWRAGTFDVPYYRELLNRAWAEIEYVSSGRKPDSALTAMPTGLEMIDAYNGSNSAGC
jgi:DNA polymerase I